MIRDLLMAGAFMVLAVIYCYLLVKGFVTGDW